VDLHVFCLLTNGGFAHREKDAEIVKKYMKNCQFDGSLFIGNLSMAFCDGTICFVVSQF
jgi:hypothetical protein